MTTFKALPDIIKYDGPSNANLDFWYGPYESKASALSSTQAVVAEDAGETFVRRYIGLTVGILDENGSSITEYWFKNGIDDDDLIQKVPDIVFPTIDELLGNVRIIKFHANGGNGHQNSELTDDDGWICLPAPTVTNSGNEFGGWGISLTDQNPTQAGNYYNCGLNNQTDFYAIWSGITNYTISWLPISNGTITCTANGIQINSNDHVPSNSTVVFTCTPNEGYSFGGSWQGDGIPSGVDTTHNPMTISGVANNITGVSCDLIANEYTVSWTNGTGYTINATYLNTDNNTQEQIENGTTPIPHGSAVTFICTVDEGYDFNGWTGLTGVDNNTTVTITLTSNISGIACNVSESAPIVVDFLNHNEETIVTVSVSGPSATLGNITATTEYINAMATSEPQPQPGLQWSGGWALLEAPTSQLPNTQTFNSGQYKLIAYYNTNTEQYTIQTYVQPDASYGFVSGNGQETDGHTSRTYTYGATIYLSAQQAPNCVFVKVIDENNAEIQTQHESGVGYQFDYTVVANKTFTAIFQPQGGFNVTATADPTAGGNVTGSGQYDYGEPAVLTAVANTNYTFSHWDDNTSDTNATKSITVTQNESHVAHFTANTYTITVSANPSAGAGTVSGGGTYHHGDSVTVSAQALQGYRFMKWTENNSDVTDAGATYTFTAESNRTLVAQFLPEYAVTVSANPSDGGSVSGNGTYVSGELVTVTASAEIGYHFVNWTENGSQVSTSDSYQFQVTGDRTLVANFAVNAPETVNVVVLSGAKQYATTLQNTITSGTITATTHNVSVGSSSGKLMVPRNTAPGSQDKNGCVILYPIEHTISTAILYDGDNQPLISNNSVGLPISSSDSTTQTTFEYNNQTYNGYVLYQFNVLPEKIEFTIQ
jgi:hypothetical protein